MVVKVRIIVVRRLSAIALCIFPPLYHSLVQLGRNLVIEQRSHHLYILLNRLNYMRSLFSEARVPTSTRLLDAIVQCVPDYC